MGLGSGDPHGPMTRVGRCRLLQQCQPRLDTPCGSPQYSSPTTTIRRDASDIERTLGKVTTLSAIPLGWSGANLDLSAPKAHLRVGQVTLPVEIFNDIPATEIAGIYVDCYKNLDNLWLGWSPAMVLVGGNGVGKSNLLECLALLMGNHTTRDLVEKRVPAQQPFDISVVAIEGRHVMLLNPEFCVGLALAADKLATTRRAIRNRKWKVRLSATSWRTAVGGSLPGG
jgi:hypothetical protein